MENIHGVSVVMPVHGEATWIKTTLESVLAQSHQYFEFIIVLDRVEPETMKILEKYRSSDNRIKIIESPESGIVHALNLGISISEFEFIARIDSDDSMAPSRLEKQLKSFSEEKELVLLGSQLQLIDENSAHLGYTKYPLFHEDIKRSLIYRNPIGHPSTMFRKTAFLESGGYRQIFSGAEDYDLWLRMINLGKIMNLRDPLTKYRRSADQVTTKNKDRQTSIDSIVRMYNVTNQTKSIRNNLNPIQIDVRLDAIPISDLKIISKNLFNYLIRTRPMEIPGIQSALNLNKAVAVRNSANFFSRVKLIYWLLLSISLKPSLFLHLLQTNLKSKNL